MELLVKKVGMVTPVGFNGRASLAAMRAGIRNAVQTNIWDGESASYLPAGRVNLPHWWVGLGKLAELVAPAIGECLEAARPAAPERTALLLGVAPPDRPRRWEGLDSRLIGEIEFRLDCRFHPDSTVIAKDRTSVVTGLRKAQQLLARADVECCIVAGVDSFVWSKMLHPYMDERRVLTPRNSNGFTPGEAGIACLVTRATPREPGLRILSTGIAREESTIGSDRPLSGAGMTDAYRQALAESKLGIEQVDYRITDLNGEHYRFLEASLAAMRLIRKPREKIFDIWHPIEYLGDIGAAIGPCLLGVALDASQRGYAIGPTSLLHMSNDDGERAAVIARYQP